MNPRRARLVLRSMTQRKLREGGNRVDHYGARAGVRVFLHSLDSGVADLPDPASTLHIS